MYKVLFLSSKALGLAQTTGWSPLSSSGIYLSKSSLSKLQLLIQFQPTSTVQFNHDLKLGLIQIYDMSLV